MLLMEVDYEYEYRIWTLCGHNVTRKCYTWSCDCFPTAAAEYEDYIALQGVVIRHAETTAYYVKVALNLSNETTSDSGRKSRTGLTMAELIGVIMGAAAAGLIMGGVSFFVWVWCCCKKHRKR